MIGRVVLLSAVGAVCGAAAATVVLKTLGLETDSATTGGVAGGVGAAIATLASRNNASSDAGKRT